jgi:hypothetical protein
MFVALVRIDRALVCCIALAQACQPAAQRPGEPPRKVKLFVFPAESADFPKTAKAATDVLAGVKVTGIDQTTVAKTSLGDAQLLIECNDPTPDCYQAVGKSLAADRLLFAVIGTEPKKKVKISVTFFDVAARRPWGHAEKVFASEADASAGLVDLIAEATK